MNKRVFKVSFYFIVLLSFILMSFGLNVKNVSAADNQWLEPAEVKRVTNTLLNTPIDPRTSETYNPSSRTWQGLPSVVMYGNRLWACWQTGDSSEPKPYNYVAIAYSDDLGETWVDPYLVVDHKDPKQEGVNLTIPNFWVYKGELYLQYMQSGMWLIKFHNADSKNVDDITWDEPVRTGNVKFHKVPSEFIDSDGVEKLIVGVESEYGDSHPSLTKFFVSSDGGYSWKLRSEINSAAPTYCKWPETSLVQTSTGKLIAIGRLDKGGGGLQVTTSSDYGYTWEPFKTNLGEPYWGPGSKVDFHKLKSGNILMINHSTTSARSEICAYLSTNDGESFDYKLMLDPRTDVSYPYSYQDEDGLIYVSWDKGRYKEKEVRLSIITEEDIIAGDFISPESKSMIKVSKLNPTYKEIVSITTNLEETIRVEKGTTSDSIKENLPTELEVKDNDGRTYYLKGTWKSSGYRQYVPGTYYFKFVADLPSTLADNYTLLKVRIIIEEPKEEDKTQTSVSKTTKNEETKTIITTDKRSSKVTTNNNNTSSGCTSLLSNVLILPLAIISFSFIKKKKDE